MAELRGALFSPAADPPDDSGYLDSSSLRVRHSGRFGGCVRCCGCAGLDISMEAVRGKGELVKGAEAVEVAEGIAEVESE